MCCTDTHRGDPTGIDGDRILVQLSAFAGTLRANSFSIGIRETEDAAKLLGSEVGAHPERLRPAFKALFSGCRAEWSKFDAIFDAFWLRRGVKQATRLRIGSDAPRGTNLRDLASRSHQHSSSQDLGDQAPVTQDGEGVRDQKGLGKMEGASRVANLAATDLRKIHDAEAMAAAHSLAERLSRHMRVRLMRRERAQRHGRRVDLRRTIRRNIGSGGVPLTLVRLARKQKPVRLVVLLDVSGSMNQYTSVFVRFVHGVLCHFRGAEAFLVHTSLAHVTPALAERDAGRALDRLSLMAQGVGGGTRIGESIATFNKRHARRVINSRTCVMIFSDGYDTGAPEHLATEMRTLAQRCRRIVWLNPMIGWDGYQPTARGMQAAMPYIDFFAPAHSIESLAALEPYLARI
jgi:uncharacterized protein